MIRNFAAAAFFALVPYLECAAAEGTFVARQACATSLSIRKGTNPGGVHVEPGRSYPFLAKNKADATHYLIDIDHAEPRRRWVRASCGNLFAADGSPISSRHDDRTRQPSFILAVSWQPAFCETRPEKSECKSQSAERFDASHFTLHGLWPQPGTHVYCNVAPELVAADKDGRWNALPATQIDLKTRRELERVMPGTTSQLDRHEWIKHGTCFDGSTAQTYFSRAIALVDQLNSAHPRALFESKVGSELTSEAIRKAFDAAFGAGAGERVRISCKRDGSRNLIVELTIGLSGEIGDEPSLAELISAAPPTSPGCPRGVVDGVGLQ
jgi:ribonuclease T2